MTEIVQSTSESAVVARDLVVVFSRLRRRLREVAHARRPDAVADVGAVPAQQRGRRVDDDLAAAERVRPQSMAATLAALDQHGLITRRPDAEDGRRQLIGLNDVGRTRVDGSRQAREEWLVHALDDHFTEDERRTVADAMQAGPVDALMDLITRNEPRTEATSFNRKLFAPMILGQSSTRSTPR